MKYIDLLSTLHKKTNRNYLERVMDNEFPKAKASFLAKKWGKEYWDGDRRTGYGGMHYDGRWKPVAKRIIDTYSLTDHSHVLDVGCGKGFLMHEINLLCPGIKVYGLDISEYALNNAKNEVKDKITLGCATNLPWPKNKFDLVISINTLHNLQNYKLHSALKEIGRVSKKNKYVCVESYRSEEEKANLLFWQLTCESFCTPDEWKWWFEMTGYDGDYSFIYFE